MQFKQVICILALALAMAAVFAEAHDRKCKGIRIPYGDGPGDESVRKCNECCHDNGYSSWYAGPITRGCGCTDFFLGGR